MLEVPVHCEIFKVTLVGLFFGSHQTELWQMKNMNEYFQKLLICHKFYLLSRFHRNTDK